MIDLMRNAKLHRSAFIYAMPDKTFSYTFPNIGEGTTGTIEIEGEPPFPVLAAIMYDWFHGDGNIDKSYYA